MRKPTFIFALFPLFLTIAHAQEANKQPTLAASLPDGALAYIELSSLSEVVHGIQNSPALDWILSTDEFAQIKQSPQFGKANAAKTIAEIILGSSLWEAAANLLDGEIAVALYPNPAANEKPDSIAIVRTNDSKTRNRIRAILKPLLHLVSTPVDTSDLYPGSQTWGQEGKGFVSMHERWFIASPKREHLDKTLRILAEKEKSTLASQSGFAEMQSGLGTGHHASAYVNTAMITSATGERFGMPQKSKEGLTSFLFSGLIELAGKSPFAGMTLDFRDHGFELITAVAGDPQSLPEPYGVYFAKHPDSGTIAIPKTNGHIAGLTIHRKLGDWYRHRQDLLAEHLLPAFDKFETDIGNLLPQKDFGQDVLPLLGDNFTIVSALQNYDHLDGEPGIKLPAFAVIFDLAKPEEGADMFKLFFQTLSSIINIQAGQEGRQPWVLDTDFHNETKYMWSRYMEKPTGERLPIVFNFQPAAAGIGRKFVIASSVQLCKDLIDHFKNPTSSEWQNQNADFQIDIAQLASLAEQNENFLRAQEIQKGTPPELAEKRIAMLLTILKQLNGLRYHSEAADGLYKLHLNGSWK
jgi:hypothetical protein